MKSHSPNMTRLINHHIRGVHLTMTRTHFIKGLFILILGTVCVNAIWFWEELTFLDLKGYKYELSKLNYNNTVSTNNKPPGIKQYRSTSLPITQSWIDSFKLSIKTPYTPMEKALDGLNITTSEEILRSGFGLQTYVTENNETIWIENGVQYRPFPYLEPADSAYYNSDFEAYIPFNKTEFFEGDEKKMGQNIEKKQIILWWLHKGQRPPFPGLNPLRACPDLPCVITSDRQYTDISSVLIINAQYVNERPPKRRPDQVLVHYQVEPPRHYWIYGDLFKKDKSWKEVFNWTMSYRMDSDITIPYGLVRRRPVVKERDFRNVLASKTGVVAWMVSQCNAPSNRTAYVTELQKYVPVDIYGRCGTKQCPRANDKSCFKDINKKYKFYLAFENSFCKDYVTEKLYRSLSADIVLIARGYNSYSRILPSEIYLNTANFESPKALAERILLLHQNDDEYVKMLKEKYKYFVVYEDYPLGKTRTTYLEYRYEAVPTCELCQRVWNIEKYSKTYSDMQAWFLNPTYQCDRSVQQISD